MVGAAQDLALTGERTQPGIWHERYWFVRHHVAYRFAVEQAAAHLAAWEAPRPGARPRVLDVGSGEGYGAEMLRTALDAPTVGLDYDQVTLVHAVRRYPGVRPVRANAVALPLLTGSVDVVVSMQTVEHLWDQPLFVSECVRVLTPGGLLVVSTPNRTTFSPGSTAADDATPLNPFHARELDAAQLTALLRPSLDRFRLVGVHAGPRLAELDETFDGLVRAQLAGPPETWSRELATAVRSVSSPDFVVTEDSPAHPLSAALDLVAVGRAPA